MFVKNLIFIHDLGR